MGNRDERAKGKLEGLQLAMRLASEQRSKMAFGPEFDVINSYISRLIKEVKIARAAIKPEAPKL